MSSLERWTKVYKLIILFRRDKLASLHNLKKMEKMQVLPEFRAQALSILWDFGDTKNYKFIIFESIYRSRNELGKSYCWRITLILFMASILKWESFILILDMLMRVPYKISPPLVSWVFKEPMKIVATQNIHHWRSLNHFGKFGFCSAQMGTTYSRTLIWWRICAFLLFVETDSIMRT